MIGSKLLKKLKKRNSRKIDYTQAPLCKYLNANCVCRHTLEDGTYKCLYKKGPSKCRFEKEISADLLEKLEER